MQSQDAAKVLEVCRKKLQIMPEDMESLMIAVQAQLFAGRGNSAAELAQKASLHFAIGNYKQAADPQEKVVTQQADLPEGKS